MITCYTNMIVQLFALHTRISLCHNMHVLVLYLLLTEFADVFNIKCQFNVLANSSDKLLNENRSTA